MIQLAALAYSVLPRQLLVVVPTIADACSAGLRRILLIVILVLIAAGIPAAETAALTVSTVTPQQERWPTIIAADGSLAPWQEVVVSSETGGLRLASVLVDVGDVVKRGQILATLDQDSLQASLDQALAGVDEATANLEQATADAVRAGGLSGRGVLSDQLISQYRITAKGAQAKLASAKAQAAMARINLERATITASDDGVVSSRTATLGSVVQSGSELFRLLRQGRIEWQAQVLDRDLPRIHPGQTATITLADGLTAAGTVRVLNPVLDAQTRTAVVHVDIASDQARAGMFCTGEILAGEAQPVLTLPQAAIVIRDGYHLVFQVTAGGTVAAIRVTTGRHLGDRVEIIGALPPESRIVAEGGAFLTDGDRVDVVATAAASTRAITTVAAAHAGGQP